MCKGQLSCTQSARRSRATGTQGLQNNHGDPGRPCVESWRVKRSPNRNPNEGTGVRGRQPRHAQRWRPRAAFGSFRRDEKNSLAHRHSWQEPQRGGRSQIAPTYVLPSNRYKATIPPVSLALNHLPLHKGGQVCVLQARCPPRPPSQFRIPHSLSPLPVV